MPYPFAATFLDSGLPKGAGTDQGLALAGWGCQTGALGADDLGTGLGGLATICSGLLGAALGAGLGGLTGIGSSTSGGCPDDSGIVPPPLHALSHTPVDPEDIARGFGPTSVKRP